MSAERTIETARVIMRIEQPRHNHNGGQIEFGPHGYLSIGSGDGGWEGVCLTVKANIFYLADEGPDASTHGH